MSQIHNKRSVIVMPTLQMKIVRLREVTEVAGGKAGNKHKSI